MSKEDRNSRPWRNNCNFEVWRGREFERKWKYRTTGWFFLVRTQCRNGGTPERRKKTFHPSFVSALPLVSFHFRCKTKCDLTLIGCRSSVNFIPTFVSSPLTCYTSATISAMFSIWFQRLLRRILADFDWMRPKWSSGGVLSNKPRTKSSTLKKKCKSWRDEIRIMGPAKYAKRSVLIEIWSREHFLNVFFWFINQPLLDNASPNRNPPKASTTGYVRIPIQVCVRVIATVIKLEIQVLWLFIHWQPDEDGDDDDQVHHIMQKQASLVKHQDEQLVLISNSVGALKSMSRQIGSELDEQAL